jgi:hypothetical protein
MTIWWLGNLVLVAVVVPAVVHLLRGVLAAALTVRAVVDDIALVGTAILRDLEPVPELITTQQHVAQTAAGLGRYGGALEEVL